MVEHLPGTLKALGSMLSTTDTLKKKTPPMFQAHQPDSNQTVPPLSSLLHTLSALPFPKKNIRQTDPATSSPCIPLPACANPLSGIVLDGCDGGTPALLPPERLRRSVAILLPQLLKGWDYDTTMLGLSVCLSVSQSVLWLRLGLNSLCRCGQS